MDSLAELVKNRINHLFLTIERKLIRTQHHIHYMAKQNGYLCIVLPKVYSSDI